MLDIFGGGRIKCTKGHIICPRFGCFHRKVSAIMAGDTDLKLFAQLQPRIGNIAVALPQMHTVRVQAFGQCHAIVNDERHIMRRADRLQGFGKCCGLMLVDIFYPELECCHGTA